MSTEKKIILVGGATASGKSAYALSLAQTHRGTLINGDSMQIYAAIPTLTAHPSAEEQQRAPHQLYGALPVSEICNAARWHQLACDAIDRCHHEGRLPIVVGGTGLYLDTLLQGLSYVPPIDTAVRCETRALCDTLGAPALYQKLRQLDPQMPDTLQPQDRQRIMRAYEVLMSTGKPLREWQTTQETSRIQGYDVHKVWVDPPRPLLYARVAQRLDVMLENGVVAEVQTLMSQDFAADHPLRKALGVPELCAYLQGDLDAAQLREKILLSTRHYAKRQLTWFRRSFADAQRVNG